MCVNHPKILTTQKQHRPIGLFHLKSFHGFFILHGRIEPIAGLLFYLIIKMWRNLYMKAISNMANSNKTLKKISKCFAHTKRDKYYFIDF